MGQRKSVIPVSKLGRSGLITLLAALVLLVVTLTSSIVMRSGENQVTNFLGVTAPLFLLATLVGVVLSWIAIAKRDGARLLVVVTIVATAGIVFTLISEVIEALTMGNG